MLNWKLFCNTCKRSFEVDWGEGSSCTGCHNPLNRMYFVEKVYFLNCYPRTELRHERPGIKKPLIEILQGFDFTRSDRTFSQKLRIIDREFNLYVEHIRHVSGRVIHCTVEKLADHWKRGTGDKGVSR